MLSPLNFGLEIQPESKLNQPGIVQGLIDYTKTGRSAYILHSSVADAAHIELRVIEQIEKLRAKLQLHALAEGQWEVFHN